MSAASRYWLQRKFLSYNNNIVLLLTFLFIIKSKEAARKEGSFFDTCINFQTCWKWIHYEYGTTDIQQHLYAGFIASLIYLEGFSAGSLWTADGVSVYWSAAWVHSIIDAELTDWQSATRSTDWTPAWPVRHRHRDPPWQLLHASSNPHVSQHPPPPSSCTDRRRWSR